MLRKRTYGSRSRSRSQRKKRKVTAIVPKLGSASPYSRARFSKARLTYSEAIQLDPGIASAASYVFAANGLFDPNITGVGHQPAGYDQYMLLYNEYVVTRSWIKIVVTNTDATSQQIVGISFLDKATTSTDARKYIEQGSCKWTGIDVYKSGSVVTLTHECDLRKVSTQDIFTEDNFTGTVGANPTDTHYWHLWGAPMDLATNTALLNVIVEIQYEVYFRDPSFTDLS